MSDLRDLYQEVIFDHNRNPRNARRPAHASHQAEGFNPLCGDRLTLYLDVDEGGVIRDLGFEGKGCAISTASASLMTEALKGRRVEEARALFDGFHGMLLGSAPLTPEQGAHLGKLTVLAGVREFPSRIKCATLAWHTLRAALEQADAAVSTEREAS